VLRLIGALGGLAAFGYLAPAPVLAHQLNERYEAPLPLVAYLAAAAFAVGISFVFVIARGGSARKPARHGEPRPLHRWLRLLLQGIGLVAWLWIVAQTLVGGNGDGDVAKLFLWVYGWVGLALVCALFFPAWSWLDPFSTIHSLLGAAATRLGLGGAEPAPYPRWLGRWPAVVGFSVVIWLELVGRVEGGRPLGLFVIAYTLITVAAMSYFGRDTWRRQGETFSVWFELLGRLAPTAVDGRPENGRYYRRPFASGLLEADWALHDVVFVALGTGAIIFDGLSQTQLYFDLLIQSSPLGTGLMRDTLAALIFLGGITLLVVGVTRLLTIRSVGAGLLPVAVGYLVAHYLTYLLVDGQQIIAALNDPLLRGDNLLPLDLGFWEPTQPLPTSLVWSVQLAAVVGGHIVGAWAGHAVLAQERRHMTVLRQLPLAILMICLTTITLWSLGQDVLVQPAAALLLNPGG